MEEQTNPKYKKYKRISRFILVMLSLSMLFLGFLASKLRFDYDFEKFFPEANDNLEFYQNFRNTFENDNDFVLVAIQADSSVFEKEFLEEVDAFYEQLKQLPQLREVISPTDLYYVKRDLRGLGFVQVPQLSIESPSKLKKDATRILQSKEPIRDFFSVDGKSLVIIIKNKQLINKDDSDELAVALAEMVENSGFDTIYTMGKIMGQKTYIEILKIEFLTFMLISIGVLLLFLILTYRSWWGIFIPLLTVMLAVIGSLGLMQLSGSLLNMMTTLLPVIMLVVGMSDVIHLVSKYLEEIRMQHDKETAIKNMLKKVGIATLLTSLTTALGFITLIGVNMEPVRDFGIFTATGVLLAFVLSILFIPSIFMLLDKPKIAVQKDLNSGWDKFLAQFFILLCRKRKAVILFYLLITLLAIIGASRIQFDYFLMQDLADDEPLMQELFFFQKEFGGVRPFELALIPQEEYLIDDFEVLKEIEKVEAFLAEEYQLNSINSPTLPYKIFNKTLRDGREAFYKIPDNEKRYEYLKKQMKPFEKREEMQYLISEDKKLGRISARLVDPGSKAMLEKNENLQQFIEEELNPAVLKIRLTGTPVIIDESGREVSKNIVIGLFIAFFIIALSMGLLFRSFKMALLSLVPNLFPIILTAGFIGFAGIDLNMTTAIVFTVAFGIAVDDTIHFLSRYRQETRKRKIPIFALKRTFVSTGKAIIITSIILLGGFASLLFSDFLSTYYIGLFVSMTLVFAVITDLTLLPLLLLKKAK